MLEWHCWITVIAIALCIQEVSSLMCERIAGCEGRSRIESTSKTIYFGLMLSYPDTQNRASFVGSFDDGHDIAPAVYLAVEQINNRTDLLSDYQVELIRADGGCNVTERTVIGINKLACSCKPVVGIIGPSCGTSSMVISQIVGNHEFSLTTIHYGQREILGNRTLFPYAFGILGSQAIYVDAVVDLVEHNSWKRLAILYSEDDVQIARSISIQKSVRELSKFEISFASAVYDNYIPLREIRDTFTRVIIILGTPGITLRTVCLAYHEHMMFPNYQWVFVARTDADFHNISFSFGDDGFACSNADIMSAINGSINLLYGSVGGDDFVSVKETDIGITLDEYKQHYSRHVEEYTKAFNVSSNEVDWAKGFYDAVWSLAFALNSSLEELDVNLTQIKTGSNLLAQSISKHMVNLNFQGISGRINFDNETGYNTETTVNLYQYDLNVGVYTRVGVYNSSCLTLFPKKKPSFISAVFEVRFVQVSGAVVAILITLTILILPVTLILQILNIIYRDYKPIKASSSWLNHLIFTGCYLIQISNTMLVVTQTETYQKSFRSDIKEHIFNIFPWFLSTGITLIIGTVFVKTLRLHRIYIKAKRLSLANMTYMNNKPLGGSVILLVCVDLLICLIWTTADRLKITTVRKIQLLQGDKFPVVLMYDSFFSRFLIYWLIVLIFPKVVLTLGSFVLALLTRFNMALKEFKTRNVVIFVYLLTATSGLVLPAYFATVYEASVDTNISVLIICAFLHLSVYICVFFLLLPPILILIKDKCLCC